MAETNKFAEAEIKTDKQDAGTATLPSDMAPGDEVVVEDKTPDTPAETPASSEWEEKYRQVNEQYLRLAADFENYRKRMLEEHESLVKYGATKSVMQLLPVLDNLARANATLNENSDPKVLYKSFEMMNKQLLDAFTALGVKKIEALGQPFDPQYHEAASQIESAEHPENSVAQELQSGYTLNDKVLRPAMVAVSSGPPAGGTAEGNPFKK